MLRRPRLRQQDSHEYQSCHLVAGEIKILRQNGETPEVDTCRKRHVEPYKD